MSKNIILAGKDYSKNSKLSQIAERAGMNPFATVPYVKDENENYTLESGSWNRGSPISAHTLIVNAENKFQKIDALALFFDTVSFNQLFTQDTVENFTQAADDLFLSYAYLTTEMLKRFQQKGGIGSGKIFFVLQSAPTGAELVLNPPKPKDGPVEKIGTIASMTQASFRAFAESLAVKYFNPNGCFIYLLETDSKESEEKIISWISKKMDEEKAAYKNQKQAVSWQSLEEKSIFGFGRR